MIEEMGHGKWSVASELMIKNDGRTEAQLLTRGDLSRAALQGFGACASLRDTNRRSQSALTRLATLKQDSKTK